MAIVEKTGGTINKLFIEIAHKTDLFAYNSESGNYDLLEGYDDAQNSVVFIEDSREIWAQGTFYGFSTENETDLASILAGLGSEIKSTKDFVNAITSISANGTKIDGNNSISIVKGISVTKGADEKYVFTYDVENITIDSTAKTVSSIDGTTGIISIAPTVALGETNNNVYLEAGTVVPIDSSMIGTGSNTIYAGDADFDDINANVGSQIKTLETKISEIGETQAGGLTGADYVDPQNDQLHPTVSDLGVVIDKSTLTFDILSYLAINKYGKLSYNVAHIDSSYIPYIETGSNSGENAEISIKRKFDEIENVIDTYVANTRDNYLSAVNRIYIAGVPENNNGAQIADKTITKDEQHPYSYVEFVVTYRTAYTGDDSDDADVVGFTYLYLDSADLINDYKGTSISNDGLTIVTSIAADGKTIEATPSIIGIDGAKVYTNVTTTNGYVTTIDGTNVNTTIQSINDGLKTAYDGLDTQIKELRTIDEGNVKSIVKGAGETNIITIDPTTAHQGTYTISADFGYVFTNNDVTAYITTGTATTYRDVISDLNKGIKTAHDGAINIATDNAYKSIATYMMWYTIGS